MCVDALSKMIASFPQSTHVTLRKFALLMVTPQSSLYELELLGALRCWLVCLARLGAAVKEVDALGWFLATWLWSRETAVTCSDSTEATLTPLQFARASLLDALDSVQSVLASRWTVAHHFAWHLDHCLAPHCLATTRPPMTRI